VTFLSGFIERTSLTEQQVSATRDEKFDDAPGNE
jgi:hypothetical protein